MVRSAAPSATPLLTADDFCGCFMKIRLFNENDYSKILDIYAQSKLDELRYEDKKFETTYNGIPVFANQMVQNKKND